MKGKILYIHDKKVAVDFLLPKHYSGRKPQITDAFGWYTTEAKTIYDIEQLKAVITIGKPASNALCEGICGKENSKYVYELNRLCRTEDWKEPLSSFVSAVMRRYTSINNKIIVSYADTGMSYTGYIYQASNFIYTGVTKQRTDKYTEGNRHSRHYNKEEEEKFRKVRTAKHRYVFFCAKGSKRKQWKKALKYDVVPYPKTENKNYTLGEYQKPIIIDVRKEKENL